MVQWEEIGVCVCVGGLDGVVMESGYEILLGMIAGGGSWRIIAKK